MPGNHIQNSAPRSPWEDFPAVLRNADIGTLKREPEYPAAKAGDARAALELADRMGGTLADLRGFVLHAGGQVLGAAVAVAHEGALNLPIRPKMVENIHYKHGIQESEEFSHEQWGYGIECLTQGEAGHLYKAVSLDALRDRFTAARNEHRRRVNHSP